MTGQAIYKPFFYQGAEEEEPVNLFPEQAIQLRQQTAPIVAGYQPSFNWGEDVDEPTKPGIVQHKGNLNLGNLEGFVQELQQAGLSFRITSATREGTKTKQGRTSHHAGGNAIDITPIQGSSYEELQSQIASSPKIQGIFRKYGMGILDETSKEMLERTGGTAPHWHVGPDSSATANFKKWFGREGGKIPMYQDGGGYIWNSGTSVVPKITSDYTYRTTAPVQHKRVIVPIQEETLVTEEPYQHAEIRAADPNRPIRPNVPQSKFREWAADTSRGLQSYVSSLGATFVGDVINTLPLAKDAAELWRNTTGITIFPQSKHDVQRWKEADRRNPGSGNFSALKEGVENNIVGAAAGYGLSKAIPWIAQLPKALTNIKVGNYTIFPKANPKAHYRNIGNTSQGYNNALKLEEIIPPIIDKEAYLLSKGAIRDEAGKIVARDANGNFILTPKQFNKAYYERQGKFVDPRRYKGKYFVEVEGVPMESGYGGNYGYLPTREGQFAGNVSTRNPGVSFHKRILNFGNTELIHKSLPKPKYKIIETEPGVFSMSNKNLNNYANKMKAKLEGMTSDQKFAAAFTGLKGSNRLVSNSFIDNLNQFNGGGFRYIYNLDKNWVLKDPHRTPILGSEKALFSQEHKRSFLPEYQIGVNSKRRPVTIQRKLDNQPYVDKDGMRVIHNNLKRDGLQVYSGGEEAVENLINNSHRLPDYIKGKYDFGDLRSVNLGMYKKKPYIIDFEMTNPKKPVFWSFQKGGKLRNPNKDSLINPEIKPNFVTRLEDPNRQFLTGTDKKGRPTKMTHLMSWGENNGQTIIYPEIQEINGQLQQLEGMEAFDSALHNNDFLVAKSPRYAKWYSRKYKNFYPKFAVGGAIYTTPTSPSQEEQLPVVQGKPIGYQPQYFNTTQEEETPQVTENIEEMENKESPLYKHKFGETKNKVKEFADVMYPIFSEVLGEMGLPQELAKNLTKQAALESGYGLSPRGAQGFNLGGIKYFGDKDYQGTKHSDGNEYTDFNNLRDYAQYVVKLLANKYGITESMSDKEFVDRLHGKNPSGANYSASYGKYQQTFGNMKSLDRSINEIINSQLLAQS